MLQLRISEAAKDQNARVSNLIAIIYDQFQLPLVENLLKQQIFFQDTLILTTSGYHESEEENRKFYFEEGTYYLLMQTTGISGALDQFEIHNMRRVMGLSDSIIGIELSAETEAAIEKIFIEILSMKMQIEPVQKNKMKLSFVNNNYRKMYSRVNEGIFYHKLMQDFFDLADETKQQRLTVAFDQGITVKEVIDIYNHCVLMEKDTFAMKFGTIKYKAFLNTDKKLEEAKQLIFEENLKGQSNFKAIEKKIQLFKFNKRTTEKLFWENRQVMRYQQLLREDKKNIELVRMYKSSPIYDLSNEVINLQIKHFHRKWVSSTLLKLKQSFNSIANRRDIKAVQQFRSRCENAMKKMRECEGSMEESNLQLLREMKEEIESFIEYHEEVIRGSFTAGLKYMKEEVGYLWRNNPKVFHRVGLFLLFVFLACLQQNFIVGLTIFSIGLIFSAINI